MFCLLTGQLAPGQNYPSVRSYLVLNLAVLATVVVVAVVVIYVLQRRSFQRRVEEARLLAVGAAMARILHQMKNPLQTVMLQAELLQDHSIGADAELRRETSQAILSEAERLRAMLNELSLWASGSRRSLSFQPVPLHQLVAQLVEVFQREAEPTGVALEVTSVAEATVQADPFFLRQAIENLLRNAIEAVHGRENARVVTVVEAAGDRALVRVADNGPGITREQRQDLFRPFISTKARGMGLGLSICKEIVEAHGGRIEVESQPGAGAEFRVRLPRISPAASDGEPAPETFPPER